MLIGVMERGPEAFIFPYYSFGRRRPRRTAIARRAAPTPATSARPSTRTSAATPSRSVPSVRSRAPSTGSRSRPWDLQVVPTTCNLCASGCAIHAGVRVQDGNVVRFSAAVNEDTNEEWLCDKGRYGNAYISSPERLSYPYVAQGQRSRSR